MIKVILFFLISISITFILAAQVPDTLVVYEYIYESDTVWFEESIRQNPSELAMLNPIKTKRSKFNLQTFPKNSSMVLETKTEIK